MELSAAMFQTRVSVWLRCGFALTVAALSWCGWTGSAAEITLESAGARYGFSENSEANGLHQTEIFCNANLPWRWELGAGVELRSRLDLTLGWIGGHHDNAFIGTLGPSLVLAHRNLPVQLDFGISPTALSRHDWGSVDVGSRFQFTTHVGADWDVTRHLRLGYRFTHMSNAGTAHPNPGLNMHMVAVSFLF
jgi:hypothetical protein